MPSVQCRKPGCARFALDYDGLCSAHMGIPHDARAAIVAHSRRSILPHRAAIRLARRMRDLGLDLTTITADTVVAVAQTMDLNHD